MLIGVRVALAIAAFAGACSPAPEHTPSVDAPPYKPCSDVQSPDLPSCASTCGNDHIDQCSYDYLNNEGCPSPHDTVEKCDGADVPKTCTDLGYYGGGPLACGSDCLDFDASACSTCAPTDVACSVFPPIVVNGLSTSGNYIGVLSASSFAIFDNTLAKVAQPATPSLPAAAVATPNGWLLATTPAPTSSLVAIDTTGAVGALHAIDATTWPAFAYGPNGRAIVAWTEGTTVYAEIVDAAGQIVVPKAQLYTGDTSSPSATTDGTNFFVASAGTLARVATDGTSSLVTTFHVSLGFNTILTWSGSAGWYVVSNADAGFDAQRFDAAGAPIGSEMSLAAAYWPVADGVNLLSLQEVGVAGDQVVKLELVSTDPTGARSVPKEIGLLAGCTATSCEGDQVRGLATLGSNLVVAVSRHRYMQLAIVAP